MCRTIAVVATLLTAIPMAAAAQSPPKKANPAAEEHVTTTLPEVLAAFLADSGVATRGLPWTTGGQLPVKWNSTKPVPSQYTSYPRVTLERAGTAWLATGDSTPTEAWVYVLGNDAGVQRFLITWDMIRYPAVRADSLLAAAGFTLNPTKCSRDTEGYSYGNLLFVIKAPGKKASGLHEGWNCAQEDCLLAYTIYYRKADAEQFDCAGT